MSIEDPLDSLLSVASHELQKFEDAKKGHDLQEVNIFSSETNTLNEPNSNIKRVSTLKNATNILHTGDTDSSDDEDNRYHEERKYNDCGREIKKILEMERTDISPSFYGQPKHRVSTWKNNNSAPSSANQIGSQNDQSIGHKPKTRPESIECKTKFSDVFIDPIFGMRITSPLVSSQFIKDKMIGREAIQFSNIKTYIQTYSRDKDWVICGVIVNKSPVRTSQKGTQFSIWTLTDLKDDIKTLSLFLFSSAHKEFWKLSVGSVVGILNPNVLDQKEGSRDIACLSVDNSQKIMQFGRSKDFGTCKSKKKNGENCTSIVNLSRCEFCLYHIKQEYQKCSRRSELQANFCGKGLTELRNKVLGKNEVFYAGKSYMAIPSKKSKKLEQREQSLMNRLNGQAVISSKSTPKVRQVAKQLETSLAQRKRDMDLLTKLCGGNTENTDIKGDMPTASGKTSTFTEKISDVPSLDESRNMSLSVIANLKSKQDQQQKSLGSLSKSNASNSSGPSIDKNVLLGKSVSADLPFIKPTLSRFNNDLIDLNKPIMPYQRNKAKINAIEFIQKNGPIKKIDPNSLKGLPKKRVLDEPSTNDVTKKPKLEESGFNSERFKKMMAATSQHTDLIEAHNNEEKEKYFNKLEVKERMEEKMVSTYKVPCKAVKCLKCKYTSFSASDLCKQERHPLKVFDAVKRFFKCTNCQNRTVSLELIPTKPCSNCKSCNWEKTGMAKEKIVTISNPLSIRGGEQKFINSVATDANLDLLVPEEGT